MKTSIIRLLSLILISIPITVRAQTNIKSAFDTILKCPDVQITERNSIEKDPSTGRKTGGCETYRFELPPSKEALIKKVYSAFDKDAEKSYSFERGKILTPDNGPGLAVGDGRNTIPLNDQDAEYVYALFLAPKTEDPDGIYRYAYAMIYKEEQGKIIGMLITTYATTLKYRQQLEQKRQSEVLRQWSKGTYDNDDDSEKSWFGAVMTYIQSMATANTQTRIALASKAYQVIRDMSKYSDVTETDKETVRQILKGMIADKKYSDTILISLLNQCLVCIK